jgi:phosphatidylserine decarboxylase
LAAWRFVAVHIQIEEQRLIAHFYVAFEVDQLWLFALRSLRLLATLFVAYCRPFVRRFRPASAHLLATVTARASFSQYIRDVVPVVPRVCVYVAGREFTFQSFVQLSP